MNTRRSLGFLVACLLALPTACGKSGDPAQGNGGANGGSSESGGASGAGGATGSGGALSGGSARTSGGEGGGASAVGGKNGSGGATGNAGASGGGGSTTDAGPPVASSGCNSPLPPACNTTTTGPCNLDVNGKAREYFVVLPAGYDNSKAVPVVFTYHGRGGTAAQLLPAGSGRGGYSLYGVQAGLPNAIYIVPQGLDSGSDAGTDYGWPNTGGQDINFVKAMLTWAETNLCVDKSRYFSDGMSYGGMMSETIACQVPDLFRAIGSMSGSLFGGARSCVAKLIAAWITHGDADTTVPISGDITARDMIIANNGCDTTNTHTIDVVDTARIGDAATTNVTCTVYDQCTSGNYPVVWCPVSGEGHAIPSFAGAEIAKFFAQF